MPRVRNCDRGNFYAGAVFLLVAVFSACSTDAADQDKFLTEHRPESPQFQITTWKTEQGLPQNRVECLLQTRDGYLWVGTGVGLARFDGVRFTTYNRANTPAFRNEACKALAEDSEGNLWIGTKDGLLRQRHGTFTRFTTQEGLCHDEISTLWVSRRGGLWIGTGGGVSRFENGKFESFIPADAARKHTYCMHEDRSGRLWIGLSAGLFRLDPEMRHFLPVWKTERPWPMESYDYVTAIREDRDGRMWFGTNRGLYALDENGVRQIEHTSANSSSEIRSILEWPDGRLWVVAGNEIYERAADQFNPLGLGTRWPGESLRCVYGDREGNHWLGTSFGGLNRLKERKLVNLTTRDGLCHDDVWSISEGKEGRVWIGTSSGVSYFQDGTLHTPSLTPDISKTNFRAVLEHSSGDLWLGMTFGGEMHYHKTETGFRSLAKAGTPNQSRALFEDKSKGVWLGTRTAFGRHFPKPTWRWNEWLKHLEWDPFGEQWIHQRGKITRFFWDKGPEEWNQYQQYLYITNGVPHWAGFDPKVWAAEIPAGELSDFDVRAILQDRAGTYWFATAGGLNRLKDGRFSNFTTRDGLTTDSLRALHEDSQGVLWIGTARGLNRLKDGRFTGFTTQQGLFDNLVNQIIEDDFGCLWIGFSRGIYRVSIQELNDVAEGRARSVNCLALGEGDGMLSSETNGGCQPAGCKTRDGKVWFPTNCGVVIIDPAKVTRNELPPPVLVEEVRVNEEVVFRDGSSQRPPETSQRVSAAPARKGSSLELPAGSGRLVEIRYTANSFPAPEKVRFKYRLQGYQTDWRVAEHRRAAYFTNLRPGPYRFQVAACNNHGVWNETGASLAFHIAPYFYETRTFRFLLAFLGLSAAWGTHVWLSRRKQRWQALEDQLALAGERARIARDIHDDVGASLTQIGLLTELAHRSLEPNHQATSHVRKIAAAADEITQSVDEIVWAANPENDTLRSLLAYLRTYVSDFLGDARVKMRLSWVDSIPAVAVSAELRHNVFMIVKEALRNIVRHSHAAEVAVKIELLDSKLGIEIADNGRGYQVDQAPADGNGLRNIRKRIEDLSGELRIESQIGKGTIMKVLLPLNVFDK